MVICASGISGYSRGLTEDGNGKIPNSSFPVGTLNFPDFACYCLQDASVFTNFGSTIVERCFL
jgi:hypothetical protein